MITIETWLTYTLACVLIILSPGPDNILAISRGLSQGSMAAVISSLGAGIGLMIHVLAAVLGVAVIIQNSASTFLAIKMVGAAYLIWLGLRALRSRDLITFSKRNHLPLRSVFLNGFLTNVLNPKPAFFILAFAPQFVSSEAGQLTTHTLMLGIWFAFLAFMIFAALGSFSSGLTRWLEKHPKATTGLNIGAGLTFIGAGLSIALLEQNK